MRTLSMNRRCIAPGEPPSGVCGGDRAVFTSSGVGTRQKSLARSATSSRFKSIVQSPGAFCHGIPMPRFSSVFGVIRADWDKSEIDRLLEWRRECALSAGLQLEEAPELAKPEDAPPVERSMLAAHEISSELAAWANDSSTSDALGSSSSLMHRNCCAMRPKDRQRVC